MVTPQTYYVDSKGKAHPSELEAWKAEFIYMVTQKDIMNEASAKTLFAHITDDGGRQFGELWMNIGKHTVLPDVAA